MVTRTHSRTGMLALLLSISVSSYADEAEWLVAPYAWLSDVSYDQSVEGGASGNISAKDLIDKSDAAGSIRIEAAKARWGLTLDYLWLATSDQVRVTVPPAVIPDVGVVAELDLGIVEVGGFYRPSADDHGVDYLLGWRRVRLERTILLIPDLGPARRFDIFHSNHLYPGK